MGPVHALNVLDAMGETARPARDAIREAGKRKQEYVNRLVEHALRRLGGP